MKAASASFMVLPLAYCPLKLKLPFEFQMLMELNWVRM
jgi:hypothetical protein